MKTSFFRTAGAVCFSLLLLLISCSRDNAPAPAVVPAAVNGMELQLVPAQGGETIKAICGDNNGYTDYQDLNLQPNTTYEGTLIFYNNEHGIRTDKTQEIKKEAALYKIIFQKNTTAETAGIPAATYTLEPLKAEIGNRPINLKFKLTTGQAGIGSFGVNLNYSNRNGSSSYYGDVSIGSYFMIVR